MVEYETEKINKSKDIVSNSVLNRGLIKTNTKSCHTFQYLFLQNNFISPGQLHPKNVKQQNSLCHMTTGGHNQAPLLTSRASLIKSGLVTL